MAERQHGGHLQQWTYSPAPPNQIYPPAGQHGTPLTPGSAYYGGAGGGSSATSGVSQGWSSGFDNRRENTSAGVSAGMSSSSTSSLGLGGYGIRSGNALGHGETRAEGRYEDESIELALTKEEKHKYVTMSEIFALIKAVDHLERAWQRDSISSKDYERDCWTLIQKYRSIKATTDGVITDMDRFVEEYKIQAPKGYYRLIKAGMPATVEVSGRNSRNDREQMKNAAQCVQNFITLMDSLQLNVKTVEALLPGSIALIETLDKVDAVPRNFEFKEKLRRWVSKMNGMRAVDELSADDSSEFALDLETSYQAFHRCLEQQS